MDEAGNIVERKRPVLWPLWVTSGPFCHSSLMSAFERIAVVWESIFSIRTGNLFGPSLNVCFTR